MRTGRLNRMAALLAVLLCHSSVSGQETKAPAPAVRTVTVNDADIQFSIGVVHYSGKGVPQDYAEAARWFRKAADQGVAMHNLSSAACTSTAKGFRRTTPKPPDCTARPPSRGMLTLRPTSASCTTKAKGCRKITPKPSAGSGRPPIRVTLMPSAASQTCTTKAKEFRRTTPRRICG